MEDSAIDASASPSPESYAFLNHSTDTVHHNLPPDVDDRQLARQKRKRTSPEDAAILEAAYQRDPKPDKTARLDLVSRVALDEKGVQIWFQNRRQTSRRKSRPLLPHEIAQYQMSRAANIQSPATRTSFGFDGLDDSGIDLTYEEPKCSQNKDEDQEAPSKNEEASHQLIDNPSSSQPDETDLVHSELSQVGASLKAAQSSAQALPATLTSVGYLANRRSEYSIRHDLAEPALPSPAMPKIASQCQLRKSGSFVRLSMNAEGKAEIVTKDASSPSPPRPQQILFAGGNGAQSKLPVPASRTFQRSASGRSRDSRSWEFWCDKEARSQLGHAAEKDASGSAAGAIGLLRTASGRSGLSPLPSKRNAPFHSTLSAAKRLKQEHKRVPLQRSKTSMGRLQSGQPQSTPKLQHSNSEKLTWVRGTDSDKENWSPDPEIDQESQDGEGSSQARQSGNDRENTQQTRGGHNRVQHHALPKTADPENDEELSTFMRGGSRKGGNASGEDLDCVQGLLSLSQGNWR